MHSKFQNKVVVPEKGCEVHFITSLNTVFSSIPVILTSIN